VLLVEDNPVNQAVAGSMLARMGLRVTLAENGRDAAEALRDGRFDLVLMDVQMPSMDGLGATRLIRAGEQPRGRHTPIVALTANAMPQERDQCLASGMDDFLPKPFSAAQLHRVLGRWLQEAAAPGPGQAAVPLPASLPARVPAAAAPPVAPSADDTPVLDREALQRIRELGGGKRPQLLCEVVELFRREVPRHLASLQQAWKQRDLQAVSTAAHSLKSTCAHVGAMRLAAACARVEREARAGQDARAAPLVERLPQQWNEVSVELEHALQAVLES
jgi:two-component system, sensor histidine kinase and response regulator